MYCARGW